MLPITSVICVRAVAVLWSRSATSPSWWACGPCGRGRGRRAESFRTDRGASPLRSARPSRATMRSAGSGRMPVAGPTLTERSSASGTRVTVAARPCRAAASSRVEHVRGALAQRAPVVGRRVGPPNRAAARAALLLARHGRLAGLAASRAVLLAHDQRSVPGGVSALGMRLGPVGLERKMQTGAARWRPRYEARAALRAS